MGKISFLGQFHSVLKLALFPLYQIMRLHILGHTNNPTHKTPPIPMA
jgi:hypothetical protein